MKKDRILIVDDEPDNRMLLEAMMDVLEYDCLSVGSGPDAIAVLDDSFDLILLDVNMPHLTGFDVAELVRKGDRCADVPIIMVTALSSMQDRLTAVQSGANDFVSKPIDLTELRIRMAAQLRVKHAQDVVKQHRQDLEKMVEARTAELQAAYRRLEQFATTDALTGLPNHQSLMTLLDEELDRCAKADLACGVLFIDIDYFKTVNDTYGHAAGDEALAEFGEIVRSVVGERGSAGRWGGEEFVAVLPGADREAAHACAEELRKLVGLHSFDVGVGCHFTCSIGVAASPADGSDRESIALVADQAMYVAKALGRNQVRTAEDVDSAFSTLRSEAVTRRDLALEGLVEALTALVSARDAWAGCHALKVQELAVRIAEALDLNHADIRGIALAAKLHDVGKIAVPDSILQSPLALSEEDEVQLRAHAEIGADVVSRVPNLRSLAPAIRAHHERWDGTGYPDGTSGAAIPLAARIIAVADAYAAMRTDLPYQGALGSEQAQAEIRAGSGTQFDPLVVEAFFKALANDPELA